MKIVEVEANVASVQSCYFEADSEKAAMVEWVEEVVAESADVIVVAVGMIVVVEMVVVGVAPVERFVAAVVGAQMIVVVVVVAKV